MKTLILTTCLLVMFSFGFAQTQRGNVMVGADLANIGLDFQEGNTQFNFTVNPKVAWFIQDNTALGAEVQLGLNTQKGATSFSYGIGALGRRYFGPGATNLARTTKVFVEVNAGIYGTNLSGTNVVKTSTNGLGLGAGPGIAWFINQNIAVEALAKYNLTVGFGNSTTTNSIDIGLGFQIYLPGRRVAELAKDPIK